MQIVPIVVWPSSGTLVSDDTGMTDTLSMSHYIDKTFKRLAVSYPCGHRYVLTIMWIDVG